MKIRSFVVIGFAVGVLVFAGVGFVFKMTEFAMTMVKGDLDGFGAAAIGIYLLGILPMILLNLWAVLTGRFRHIEGQKYRMFELDEQIEREGNVVRNHG